MRQNQSGGCAMVMDAGKGPFAVGYLVNKDGMKLPRPQSSASPGTFY